MAVRGGQWGSPWGRCRAALGLGLAAPASVNGVRVGVRDSAPWPQFTLVPGHGSMLTPSGALSTEGVVKIGAEGVQVLWDLERMRWE